MLGNQKCPLAFNISTSLNLTPSPSGSSLQTWCQHQMTWRFPQNPNSPVEKYRFLLHILPISWCFENLGILAETKLRSNWRTAQWLREKGHSNPSVGFESPIKTIIRHIFSLPWCLSAPFLCHCQIITVTPHKSSKSSSPPWIHLIILSFAASPTPLWAVFTEQGPGKAPHRDQIQIPVQVWGWGQMVLTAPQRGMKWGEPKDWWGDTRNSFCSGSVSGRGTPSALPRKEQVTGPSENTLLPNIPWSASTLLD